MKSGIRLLIVICVFLSAVLAVYAQPSPREVVLGQVIVERNASAFTIHYSIEMGELVRECDVKLFLIVNGRELTQDLTVGVSGDVGTIYDGGKKQIIWQMSQGDINRLHDKTLAFKVSISSKKLKKRRSLNNDSINNPRNFYDPIYRQKK